MRIISFINQPDVIKKILGLWEEPHAPPEKSQRKKDYLRSILQPQPKADPPQVEANLKASYPNRGADVQPYLQAGLRLT